MIRKLPLLPDSMDPRSCGIIIILYIQGISVSIVFIGMIIRIQIHIYIDREYILMSTGYKVGMEVLSIKRRETPGTQGM